MALIDIAGQQTHAENLEHEVAGWYVKQTQQEEPKRTEIEGKQSVPEDDRTRSLEEFLTHGIGYLVRATKLLVQTGHQVLERRGVLLLILGIADIRLLESTFHPRCRGIHLVVNFLLTTRIVEFAAFLAFQEEQVYLYIIVSQPLLTRDTHEARYATQHQDYASGNEDVLIGVRNAQPRELDGVMLIEAIDHSQVDGNEPYEACRPVEDTPQGALLACQTGQLAVGTVKDICHHQHKDGHKIHAQAPPA